MTDDYDEIYEAEPIEFTVNITKLMILFTPEEGNLLKDVIIENQNQTLPWYCRKVGISAPNLYNVCNGQRPCTIEWLNKLLSGIEFEASFNNKVHIGPVEPTIVPNIEEPE